MESDWSWDQNALIHELIQGMEVAKKLKEDLRMPYSVETRDLLLQRILSCYEKALVILRCNASTSQLQAMSQATTASLLESPLSVHASPLHGNVDGHPLKHDSKKRKITPKWMDQVRVSCESGLEGPREDGYNWRKYGQKDILGTKYPRSYYRCTFRNTRGCWATKQVQRSDEDPTIFDITYRGKHTCSQRNNAVLPPQSPDKPHSHNIDIHHASQESLTKLRNTLFVSTDKLDNGDMGYPFTFPSTSFGCMKQENHSLIPFALENESFLSDTYQTHLLSPTTSELNYFPSPTFQMNEFDGIYNELHSILDMKEIISTNTSATNSPIPQLNFSLDPLEIDPNFIFNTPGIFS